MPDAISIVACLVCAVLLFGGVYAFFRYYHGDREAWIWTSLACFAVALLLASALQRAHSARVVAQPAMAPRAKL